MNGPVAMYGFSRGYRILAALAGFVLLALVVSLLKQPSTATVVTVAGTLAFAALFAHAAHNSSSRIIVLTMTVEGFELHDPALPHVLITWDMLEEIRIYATYRHPKVGFGLVEPQPFFRGLPLLYRPVFRIGNELAQYPVIVQLDETEHQISAIQSAAQRHRIPVRTELA